MMTLLLGVFTTSCGLCVGPPSQDKAAPGLCVVCYVFCAVMCRCAIVCLFDPFSCDVLRRSSEREWSEGDRVGGLCGGNHVVAAAAAPPRVRGQTCLLRRVANLLQPRRAPSKRYVDGGVRRHSSTDAAQRPDRLVAPDLAGQQGWLDGGRAALAPLASAARAAGARAPICGRVAARRAVAVAWRGRRRRHRFAHTRRAPRH